VSRPIAVLVVSSSDFGEETEGKRPLGRPTCIWQDDIKMDLRDMGQCVMDWIDLAQDRDQWRVLVNTKLNLRVS
jgi:hypothetical protein